MVSFSKSIIKAIAASQLATMALANSVATGPEPTSLVQGNLCNPGPQISPLRGVGTNESLQIANTEQGRSQVNPHYRNWVLRTSHIIHTIRYFPELQQIEMQRMCRRWHARMLPSMTMRIHVPRLAQRIEMLKYLRTHVRDLHTPRRPQIMQGLHVNGLHLGWGWASPSVHDDLSNGQFGQQTHRFDNRQVPYARLYPLGYSFECLATMRVVLDAQAGLHRPGFFEDEYVSFEDLCLQAVDKINTSEFRECWVRDGQYDGYFGILFLIHFGQALRSKVGRGDFTAYVFRSCIAHMMEISRRQFQIFAHLYPRNNATLEAALRAFLPRGGFEILLEWATSRFR